MQRFRDGNGVEWDVVLGRESWGALLALFVPVSADSGQPVRQAPLHASAYDAATTELDEMDGAALQALLDRSVVKEEGT
ncbi:MAG TPA: hypothetical protein VK928_02710 [Longimicrobiales bacterium]|nr:hypothetical protein [Longimicrobiales bacterium]